MSRPIPDIQAQPAADTASPPDMDIGQINRAALVDTTGLRYKDLRRRLTPDFGKVWRDIGAGYAALAVSVGVVAALERAVPGLWPLWGVLGAATVGYIVAYLLLFLHEAAHYNIASTRERNDRLANLFIGSLTGQDVAKYRVIHFDHHRYLGTPRDTERTYFDALTWRFIVESLTGVKVLRVFRGRDKAAKAKSDGDDAEGYFNRQMIAGVMLNGAIVGAALLTGYWGVALAWVAGMGVVMPFFGALRQLLEHRSEDASRNEDYTVKPHGAVNRMFGDGPVASTLGGAGFNRHLLHHWDAQVSYTRFAELERYLDDTEFAPILARARTTYGRTFLRLFGV